MESYFVRDIVFSGYYRYCPITEGQRRIPVQYAKKNYRKKMYGGQSTHIPIRVNQAGVIQ